jgi:hypothetical protein
LLLLLDCPPVFLFTVVLERVVTDVVGGVVSGVRVVAAVLSAPVGLGLMHAIFQ